MRYRVEFEHAEIKHCWDCPMLMSEAGAEKVDYCIGMGLVVETAKGIPDICPLEDTDAEISRQEQCEWCSRFSTMATQDNTAIYPPTREKVVFNYCPNCGREL